tara:strand:- start:39 stop:233 length:195 start_codon:yes stop_codon:yes gene_type:complete
MNTTNYIKELLDEEYQICKHTTGVESLRKIIAFLKTENYVIYAENCPCGLVERKHKSYIKDWAI